MRRACPSAAAFAAGLAACLAVALAAAIAQPYQPPSPPAAPSGRPNNPQPYMSETEALLKTPVSGLHPGGINLAPPITNPPVGNPVAVQRGMQYFTAFNCIGCHAANGGGGMGPALSNRFFRYGASPADIYLTIAQGRPEGMPAWGSMLPSGIIWDLVAYVEEISKAPVTEWGTTISANSLDIEQVPAEFKQTDAPWSYTEPFTKGQKPTGPYPPAGE